MMMPFRRSLRALRDDKTCQTDPGRMAAAAMAGPVPPVGLARAGHGRARPAHPHCGSGPPLVGRGGASACVRQT